MVSHLRNLLFQLLRGLDTLRLLTNASGDRGRQWSEQEQQEIQSLIAFLIRLTTDMHQYLGNQSLSHDELGNAYMNFQAALSLTLDRDTAQGPAYAVQPAAQDNRVWSGTIRNLDKKTEDEVSRKLSNWSECLGTIIDKGLAEAICLEAFDEMFLRFEQTAELVERAL